MTIQQTCPHCGAERHLKYADMYECGTSNSSWFDTRSRLCHRREVDAHAFKAYESQLAAKDTEIERLKQSVLDENMHCSEIADQLGTFGYDGHKIAKAIRARGEVK